MKSSFLFLVLLIFLNSCKSDQTSPGFEINGVVKNIPDSTQILLYIYPNVQKAEDSTLVIDEKFSFEGKVERPRLAMLRIVQPRDVRMFWLEDKQIVISGVQGL